MKIKEINIENKLYPNQLRNIKKPPQKLYLLGDEIILNKDSLSIIGSRCCTEYGAKIARKYAREIAQNGVAIVSGMAKGIDSYAHLGAIEGAGKTIAVLGSGFNHVFPDKNVFNKILENGGTIITEYDKDVDVFSQGFIERNRIVAGLSIGTFVVEAKQKSGTSITAAFAKSFKRKIFCIPHIIEDKAGLGTNKLLKNGAILVTQPEDILQHFQNIEKIEKTSKEYEIEVPDEYRIIYEQIKKETLNANEISKRVKMSISEVNTILTMLELEGYILSLPGNYFKKKE